MIINLKDVNSLQSLILKNRLEENFTDHHRRQDVQRSRTAILTESVTPDVER
jgi:hypothetical protein